MAAFGDRATDQGYQQFTDYVAKTKGKSYNDAYGFQGNEDAAYANYVSGMGGAVAGRGRTDFDNFKQFQGGAGAATAAPTAAPPAPGQSSGGDAIDSLGQSAMQGLSASIATAPTPGWSDDPALAQTADGLGQSQGPGAMGMLSQLVAKKGLY